MAKSVFNFHSEVLNFHETVHVVFPETAAYNGLSAATDEPMSVLYLLHGMGGGTHSFLANTSLERYLNESGKHMAIVMPDMGNDAYTDHVIGWPYMSYVAEELPRIMRTFMRITDDRAKTTIAGVGVGGYGALKIALNNPDAFGLAASFSGIVDMKKAVETTLDGEDGLSLHLRQLRAQKGFMFGDALAQQDDVFELIKSCGAVKPKLFLSCGEEDLIAQQNKMLNALAVANGFEVTLEVQEDAGYGWRAWDKDVEELILTLAP